MPSRRKHLKTNMTKIDGLKHSNPLNITAKSRRHKFMQLYSTSNLSLNSRFSKIMNEQRKRSKKGTFIEVVNNLLRLDFDNTNI